MLMVCSGLVPTCTGVHCSYVGSTIGVYPGVGMCCCHRRGCTSTSLSDCQQYVLLWNDQAAFGVCVMLNRVLSAL
jgi:hypothetical protein